MLPYTRDLILDNTNNYGIVKTETLFGFGPPSNSMDESFNTTKPLEWIITSGNFSPRSMQEFETRSLKTNKKSTTQSIKLTKSKKSGTKSSKRRTGKGKMKKCFFKVVRNDHSKKSKRRGGKLSKMHKKYMMPLILGFLAAKSLLVPIALKALAFLSTKGLMMGFFSTVLASVLSLKGMFDHHHGYQNRKDDTKTQVEIIQVPSKSDDHYYDDHYKREDYVPMVMN